MAHAASALRLNAVELLRSPGSIRDIVVALPAAAIDLDDARVIGDVAVALTATSSVDGIVVHGTVSVPWHGQCRRCLRDVSGVGVAAFEEVYQQTPRLDDAVEIVGDQIDLAPVTREYALLELPEAPLCRDDCAGICPQCGADLDDAPCDCDVVATDLRWSALDGIRLDDPGT